MNVVFSKTFPKKDPNSSYPVWQEIFLSEEEERQAEEERLEIVRWIKDKTSRATENLNLRLLFTCFEFYIFDKDNWKTLASKIIKNNEDLLLIVQGLSEQEWCSETGRHRATYYRLKQQVVEKEEKWKKIKAI